MTEFVLIDNRRNNEKTFDSKSIAEEKRNDLIGLGATPEDLEIRAVESENTVGTDDGQATELEEETNKDPKNVETDEPIVEADTIETAPQNPSVADDPIDWVPGHFVDEIQGVPAINRKGYAVLSEQYGISVVSDPVTLPNDTDFEYAAFRATATTEDGREYSGFGSAHVDRGDDAMLLAELAETRSMKRAAAWATGVGMTAVSELKNEL